MSKSFVSNNRKFLIQRMSRVEAAAVMYVYTSVYLASYVVIIQWLTHKLWESPWECKGICNYSSAHCSELSGRDPISLRNVCNITESFIALLNLICLQFV